MGLPIYVDTDSGSWGPDMGNLVFIEVPNDILDKWLEDGSPDSEIIEDAKRLNREQNQTF